MCLMTWAECSGKFNGRGLRAQFWGHATARQSLGAGPVIGVALVAVTGM